jgi:hypothetical protein
MSIDLNISSWELIETEGCLASYKDSNEIRDKVFDEILSFCKRHETFCSESMTQCDNPMIEAGFFLGEVIDKIGFEVEYID